MITEKQKEILTHYIFESSLNNLEDQTNLKEDVESLIVKGFIKDKGIKVQPGENYYDTYMLTRNGIQMVKDYCGVEEKYINAYYVQYYL